MGKQGAKRLVGVARRIGKKYSSVEGRTKDEGKREKRSI